MSIDRFYKITVCEQIVRTGDVKAKAVKVGAWWQVKRDSGEVLGRGRTLEDAWLNALAKTTPQREQQVA